jgi:hypothetical protein
MRNVTPIETPSLFPELLEGNEPGRPAQPAQPAEETLEKPDALARGFVRWCWSFGGDFRNSPDITNFRFWLRKAKVTPSPAEEEQILEEARRLFLKKVEQAVRKADVLKGKD